MIIRQGARPQDHFTVIPNLIARDDSLSWKARGLFLYLASNVDGWEISLEKLTEQSQDGLASTRTGVNELIAAGYLVRSDRQVHGRGGAFGGYEYTLSYEPSFENHTKALTSADAEAPSCGNRTEEPAKTARDHGPKIAGPKKTIPLEDQEKTAAAADHASEQTELDRLVDGLRSHGLTASVRKLDASGRAEVVRLIQRCGVDALVRSARQQHRPEAPARFVQAWLSAWRELPDARGTAARPPKCGRCDEHGWLPDDEYGRAVRCPCRRLAAA